MQLFGFALNPEVGLPVEDGWDERRGLGNRYKSRTLARWYQSAIGVCRGTQLAGKRLAGSYQELLWPRGLAAIGAAGKLRFARRHLQRYMHGAACSRLRLTALLLCRMHGLLMRTRHPHVTLRTMFRRRHYRYAGLGPEDHRQYQPQ